MLAEPQFVEAERVGVKRLLLVLGERVGKGARRRMHRHHEQAKSHLSVLRCRVALTAAQRQIEVKDEVAYATW